MTRLLCTLFCNHSAFAVRLNVAESHKPCSKPRLVLANGSPDTTKPRPAGDLA